MSEAGGELGGLVLDIRKGLGEEHILRHAIMGGFLNCQDHDLDFAMSGKVYQLGWIVEWMPAGTPCM